MGTGEVSVVSSKQSCVYKFSSERKIKRKTAREILASA